ncbi:RIP metalloprotease RseP [Kineothrix sp. MB12-C1]|uniref:RIP metalloprotease RseP n=1 Tax=Kineothrix sp. MB12-C1 TaxID=3070215 RepID=UPI002F42A1C7
MIITILLFLLIFGVIVISHELGHFLLAKKNGIRVIEFAIGMGPTLFHVKKGETIYSLKAFPIGGACIFDGEDGVSAKDGAVDEGSFLHANVWARISAVLAGPLFNFLLAFVLALIIVAFTGSDRPVVQQVTPGGAAQAAGIESGDLITKINGESIHLYRQVNLISALNKGEELNIQFERQGEKYSVTISPIYDSTAGRYYIGLMGAGEYFKCNPIQVFQYSFYELEYWVKATVKSLGMLFTGQVSKDDMAGPVGIAQIVGETYEEVKPYGISSVVFSMMNIAILLSVNLGILNLLPLPALDGGRLVFLLIEAIRGKPIPPEKEGMVHLAGMAALMILMVFVLFNDISRLFT